MFSIVIPMFNEAGNITSLINEINKSLENIHEYEIILVDDASTDNTLELLNKNNFKKTKVLKNHKNRGQSFSIYEGVKKSSYKTIVTLDGDGQNDPADITKLYSYYVSNNKIKLVGGIRQKRKDSLIKIISSKIANLIRSLILNDQCKDTGCLLKVFDKNIFLSFPFFDGVHRFLPALYKGFGYKTKFVIVNHRKRIHGISKYGTVNRLFAGIRDLIKVKKILNKRY